MITYRSNDPVVVFINSEKGYIGGVNYSPNIEIAKRYSYGEAESLLIIRFGQCWQLRASIQLI